MIKAACKALNSYGITSVQSDDYGVFRSIPAGILLRRNRRRFIRSLSAPVTSEGGAYIP